MSGNAFFSCEKAKEIWQVVGLWQLIRPKADAAKGFTKCLLDLLQHLHQTDMNKLALSCRKFGKNVTTWFGICRH